WLRPLQVETHDDGLTLYAPNEFVVDQVREHYLARIRELVAHFAGTPAAVALAVGSLKRAVASPAPAPQALAGRPAGPEFAGNVDAHYTFENFVEGRSNQLGRAAAL